MSISVVRYIELLSIEQVAGQHYLHLHVHLQHVNELYMEVDPMTAFNLQSICAFDELFKYRLSLRVVEDFVQRMLVSNLTKTRLTESQRIDFEVSLLYKKHITAIKNCTSVEELAQLSFIKRALFAQPLPMQPTIIETAPSLPTAVQSQPKKKLFKIKKLATVSTTNEQTEQSKHEATDNELSKSQTQSVSALHFERMISDEEAQFFTLNLKNEAPKETNKQVKQVEPPSENEELLAPIAHSDEQTNEQSEALQQPTEEIDQQQPEVLLVKDFTEDIPKDEELADELKDMPDTLLLTRAQKKKKHSKGRTIFISVAVLACMVAVAAWIVSMFEPKEVDIVEGNTDVTSQQITTNDVQQYFEIEDAYTYELPAQYAAITFTKGPSPHTIEITNILYEHGIGATFFVLGKYAEQYRPLIEQLHAAGYPIGHATKNYSLLTNLSFDDQTTDVQQTNNILQDITGETPTLFRPPYSLFNRDTMDVIQNENMQVVLWNIDPYNVKAETSKEIIDYIQSQQSLKGVIINLPESNAAIEALPTIIRTLEQANLQIVTLQ